MFVFIGQQARLLSMMAYTVGREYAAVFISAIADKNERGCVDLLHSVTNTHTSSNLCVVE